MNRLRPALMAAAIFLAGATSPAFAQAPAASSRYLDNLTPDNSVFVAVDYLTGFQPAIRTMDKDLYRNNLTGLAWTVARVEVTMAPRCGGAAMTMPLVERIRLAGGKIAEMEVLYADTAALVAALARCPRAARR